MKRVFIQVVDPVHKTNEQASLLVDDKQSSLDQACLHLGFDPSTVTWNEPLKMPRPIPSMPDHQVLTGFMEVTSRLITYIEYSDNKVSQEA